MRASVASLTPTPVSGKALAAGEKPKPVKATKKSRNEAADRVYGLASSYLESQKQPQVDHASRTGLQEAAARLRDSSQEHPVPAFHWEIEFPEVFSRENGGFDAFVGNPPFLGRGVAISNASGKGYLDWLMTNHPDSHGNGDLVAHFFRRSLTSFARLGAWDLLQRTQLDRGYSLYRSCAGFASRWIDISSDSKTEMARPSCSRRKRRPHRESQATECYATARPSGCPANYGLSVPRRGT